MRPRRALLFMPGDDRHKIEKGAALAVDAVIMDLEDGVAFSHKQIARDTVAEALQTVDFGATEKLVRINPAVGGGLYVAEIETIAPHRPDGFVIPKVETAAQIQDVSHRLAQVEAQQAWAEGTFKLLAIVESARGVMNLREIVESDERLVALIFGAEDLASDLGAIRTPDGWEVFYGRSAVVLHARALGLQAIDTIYPHLQNINGLESETEQALYMGFTGKLAIHPRQVSIIQAVYTPSAEEVQRSQRLVAAYKEHQAAGEGVFVLDGKMIDQPMVRAAELVLARARWSNNVS
jgi:citrate lyase beta subunit